MKGKITFGLIKPNVTSCSKVLNLSINNNGSINLTHLHM